MNGAMRNTIQIQHLDRWNAKQNGVRESFELSLSLIYQINDHSCNIVSTDQLCDKSRNNFSNKKVSSNHSTRCNQGPNKICKILSTHKP